MSTELTENTEKSDFFRVFREFRGHSFFFFVFLRTTIRPFLVFCERFRSALFAPKGLHIIAQGCGASRYPGFAGRAEQP
ncbi:MAG: hypothetical protein BECKG1743E_GA0114224_109471 [Candidatus Kentron sp. G]|nr:MAG: hypothetical protein BECKG1743E_GA0114224_109471 [Candidatus Kentron sp. G]